MHVITILPFTWDQVALLALSIIGTCNIGLQSFMILCRTQDVLMIKVATPGVCCMVVMSILNIINIMLEAF